MFLLVYVAFIIAFLTGWIMNLWAVVQSVIHNDPFTAALIVRIVGIPVALLGAIIGWF